MLPIIIALDFDTKIKALDLLMRCDPALCRVKIGKGMFTRFGPVFVKQVIGLGFEVFLDLKFHDIPNTVYDACRASIDMGVWMLNVHAIGGEAMMKKAKEAVTGSATQLIAVTMLTSMNESQFKVFRSSLSLSDMVFHLAQLAYQANFDGVVSSAHEASVLKKHFGHGFKLITPGIRLLCDETHDQKRVMTPNQALSNGADYLVIGRSITMAKDPMEKLRKIQREIINH